MQINIAEKEIDGKEYKYKVGNITFIVTPVYPEKQGETMFDIFLKLMKADVERI